MTRFFPKSLKQVFEEAGRPSPCKLGSWGCLNYIIAKGDDVGISLTSVTADALRGERRLAIASSTGLSVGQTMQQK